MFGPFDNHQLKTRDTFLIYAKRPLGIPHLLHRLPIGCHFLASLKQENPLLQYLIPETFNKTSRQPLVQPLTNQTLRRQLLGHSQNELNYIEILQTNYFILCPDKTWDTSDPTQYNC